MFEFHSWADVLGWLAALIAPFVIEASRRIYVDMRDKALASIKQQWLRNMAEAALEVVLSGHERTGKAAKQALEDGNISKEEFANICVNLRSDAIGVLRELAKLAPKYIRPWVESMIPHLIESALAKVKLTKENPTTAPKTTE